MLLGLAAGSFSSKLENHSFKVETLGVKAPPELQAGCTQQIACCKPVSELVPTRCTPAQQQESPLNMQVVAQYSFDTESCAVRRAKVPETGPALLFLHDGVVHSANSIPTKSSTRSSNPLSQSLHVVMRSGL